MKIFARVDLVADVHAALIERVQNRQPSSGKLLKSLLNKALWSLGPRIDHVPHQGTAKSRMRVEPQILGSLGRVLELLDCPLGASLVVAAYGFGCKAIELLAKCGMDGHKLTL